MEHKPQGIAFQGRQDFKNREKKEVEVFCQSKIVWLLQYLFLKST